MQVNPYLAPAQPVAGYYAAPPRLFTANTIALAAFLGSALGGALLYAFNLRRIGAGAQVPIALGLGVLTTAAIFAIAFALPDSATGLMSGVNIGMVFGVRALAQRRFEPVLNEAQAHGVKPHSGWWAALVSVVVLIPLAVIAFGGAMALQKTVAFGEEQEIMYEGDATEAEARKVGEDLTLQEFFGSKNPGPKTVTLAKDKKGFTLGFFVQEGSWKDETVTKAFTCIGGRVRQRALNNAHLTVTLLDSWGTVKKELPTPAAADVDKACEGYR